MLFFKGDNKVNQVQFFYNVKHVIRITQEKTYHNVFH